MRNEENITKSLDKLQRDIDSIKQDIKSQNINRTDTNHISKTVVNTVQDDSTKNKNPGSSKLEGDIETI